MEEKKMYYLGTGSEFVKAQCKEYKTIEGALKAAAKDDSLVVWDEKGNIIGSMTEDVPEDALKTNSDGSVNAYDAEGNIIGKVTIGKQENVGEEIHGDIADVLQDKDDGKEADSAIEQPAQEKGKNGANTTSENENFKDEAEEEQDDYREDTLESGVTKEEYGKFVVTVTCEGSLRLRRTATFEIDNECGRATKGQTYIGKKLFMCDGLPMVETVDGLFLSAAAEHVKIMKIG